MEKAEKEIVRKVIELLEEYDGKITISDYDITIGGTRIDNIVLLNTWDNEQRVALFAGDPFEEESDWEELKVTENNVRLNDKNVDYFELLQYILDTF